MKKKCYKILVLLIPSLIFLSMFFFTSKPANAACEFLSAKFYPSGMQMSDWYKEDAPPNVYIAFETKGCENTQIAYDIVGSDAITGLFSSSIFGLFTKIVTVDQNDTDPDTGINTTVALYKAGEDKCHSINSPNCTYILKLGLPGTLTMTEKIVTNGQSPRGTLQYPCDGIGCTEGDWTFVKKSNLQELNSFLVSEPKGLCEVINATLTPNGLQPSGWYKHDNPPEVVMRIETKKCEGQEIEISLVESDTLWGDDVGVLDNFKLLINPAHTVQGTGINVVKMTLQAGTDDCDATGNSFGTGIGGTNVHCYYFISILTPGPNNDFQNNQFSSQRATSRIGYDYDVGGTDGKKWKILTVEGLIGAGVGLISGPGTSTGLEAYQLLAPLQVGTEKFSEFKTDQPDSFKKYLTIIFRLMIGIAGLLSVIMIVVGGIEYMSTDAISGKEEGKERIRWALIGLILALAAWLILNTINPDILSLNIGIKNAPVTENEEGDLDTSNLDNTILEDSSLTACATGTTDLGVADGYKNGQIVKIKLCALPNLKSSSLESTSGSAYYVSGANGNAIINASVSGKWKALVDAAIAAGIDIKATSGFRTMKHQQDLYSSDPDKAAKPGRSPHQLGLAIDFVLPNVKGTSKTSCFGRGKAVGNPLWDWLYNNAETYGMRQYSYESWHWDPLTLPNRCGKTGTGATTPSTPSGPVDVTLECDIPGIGFEGDVVTVNDQSEIPECPSEEPTAEETVEGPAEPTVGEISPEEPVASSKKQWINIVGSGFETKVTLYHKDQVYVIPANRTEHVNSELVKIYVSLFEPGEWTAIITNDAGVESEPFIFTVLGEDKEPTTNTNTGSAKTKIVTIEKKGGGTGTIGASPSGLSCGSTCTKAYPIGTTLTLAALPNQTSLFESWSGPAGCNGVDACSFEIEENVSDPIKILVNFKKKETTTTTTTPSGSTGTGTATTGTTTTTPTTTTTTPSATTTTTGTGTGTSSAPTAAVITSFTATPVKARRDESVKLAWATTGAVRCYSPNFQTVNKANYSVFVKIASTATGATNYRLICENSAGTKVEKTISVALDTSARPPGPVKPVESLNADSSGIPCDSRTTDLGVHDGYLSGKLLRVRLCSLPNFPATTGQCPECTPGNKYYIEGASNKAIVNSRVSGTWYDFIDAAKKAGYNLQANSSFRGMANQQGLYDAYVARNYTGSVVGRPGHSPHQRGISVDINDGIKGVFNANEGCTKSGRATKHNHPAWKWIYQNAGRFGLKQFGRESWHWGPTENCPLNPL